MALPARPMASERRSRCGVLGTGFEVGADDEPTAAQLADLFGGFARLTDTASVHHRLLVRGGSEGGAHLEVDGVPKRSASQPLELVGEVVHAVNQCVLPELDALVLHAGVVERHGVGVLLPAAMESGKSTVTAALVRDGWRYLSDEAGVVPWDGEVRVVAFPKPISLDQGSWPLFPELRATAQGWCEGFVPNQWQVPATAFRPDAVAPSCRPRLVVFRRFLAGEPTTVEPLTQGAAVVELAKNTFRFDEHGRRGLDRLADLVRGASCWRLTGGDLAEAVAAVDRLAGAPR